MVKSVQIENEEIDRTMTQFLNIENNMYRLDTGIDGISESTQEVVSYNNRIMEHIEQLSAATEELNASTEEALHLYEENKTKTQNTKIVMDKVEKAMQELVEM